MGGRAQRLLVAAWLIAAAVACGNASFECSTDGQCDSGVCISPGFCAFPTDDCESGLQFGEHASSDLAGMCVPMDDGTSGATTVAEEDVYKRQPKIRSLDPDCCGTHPANATQRLLMGVRLHWGWLIPATLLTLSCGEDEGSVWDGQGQSGDTAGDDDDDAASNDGAATGTAGATGTGGDDDDDDSADDTGGVKLDVGPDTDGGIDGACGCQYSYIWVANTEESTVSKINTKTLEEEGRYHTVPSG